MELSLPEVSRPFALRRCQNCSVLHIFRAHALRTNYVWKRLLTANGAYFKSLLDKKHCYRGIFLPAYPARYLSWPLTPVSLWRTLHLLSPYRRSQPTQTPLGQEAGRGVLLPERAEVKVEEELARIA